MKTLLIANFLFLCVLLHAQPSIVGTIIDTEKQLPVAYASLGFEGLTHGTISNSDGKFKLPLPEGIDQKAKIQISCIGYETFEISFDQLQQNSTIQLQPSITQLNEVAVFSKNKKGKKPNKIKSKKLGKSSTFLPLFHAYYSIWGENDPNNLGREKGMIYPIKSLGKVNSLNFHISSNNYRLIKFRLKFYTIEKGKPTTLLHQKDILFDLEDSFLGWYQLDLSAYDIILQPSQKKVGVALQWVDSEQQNEGRRFFSISAAIGTSPGYFFKEDVFEKWIIKKGKLNMYVDVLPMDASR
ncbi:carboxypeptidase-like regulatory domain-containing protein [Flammeovirga pacifica]|nr:carboxypeptidase-like regulatory domain-containing protein [Flammeovirga pacifica]